MYQCEKCLENRWSFRKIEREVFATCEGCGHEVSFVYTPKAVRGDWKKKTQYFKEQAAKAAGQILCRRCGAICEKRTHDGPQPGKTVWYAWWFRCPKCKWLKMPGDAVRGTQSKPELPLLENADNVESFKPDPDWADDGRLPWE